MNANDELRAALNAVTRSMDAAIALAKQQGRFEERDQLISIREVYTRTANRICNGAGPRGRLAAPPIVPASYSLKPMVRALPRVARPALRLVEVVPFAVTVDRLVADAKATKRASAKLLADAESEVPHAG